MRRISIFVAVITLAAGTAFATVATTDQYVPAVAHASGQNQAAWRADLWIFNPSATQSATVTIFLLLRQANPNPASQMVTIGPGDTRYFQDVVGAGLFQQTNASGGLHITSTIPVLVTAESYNANVTTSLGTGTSGQFFSGLPATWALGLNDTTDMPGFDQDALGTSGLFHSNLGVVETTGNPVTYTIQLYDASGNPIGGAKSYSLHGYEVGQINNVITDVSGGTGTNVRLHITVVQPSSGQMLAVGSRIDNRTGDPSTIDQSSWHTWGVFEGVVFDAATGTVVDGGIQLKISNQTLTYYDALGDLCAGTSGGTVTGDVTPDGGASNVAITGNAFTATVTIPYSDGTNTIFTTTWTLNGTRGGDGSWSGTLASSTTGGTGSNAGCNGNSTQNWRAAWTSSGS